MMWLLHWDCIAFILLFGNEANGIRTTSSCGGTIYINCNSYQIVIVDVNSTSSLTNDLLQHCNALHQCHVENTYKECVEVSYWCKMYVEPFQITKSSTVFASNKSLMGLTNENFRQGQYAETHGIFCHLGLTKKTIVMKLQIKLRTYEFGAWPNCSPICMNVENSQMPEYCAKMRKSYYTSFDYSSGDSDWMFNITVGGSKNCVAKIRFWIELEVEVPENMEMWCLECNHESGNEEKYIIFSTKLVPTLVEGSDSASWSVSIKLSIALGALLLIAVLVILVMLCRKGKISCKGNSYVENAQEEGHNYTYIDPDHIPSAVEVSRTHNSIPSLREIIPLSRSLAHMAGSRTLDRELPPPPWEAKDCGNKLTAKVNPTHNNDEVCPDDALGVAEATIKDIGDQDEEDGTFKAFPPNVYMGLSQDTLNVSDTSSRSSTGILYTLMDGVPRGMHQETNGSSNEIDTANAEETSQEATAQGQRDKDEHGYFVVLPGSVPPEWTAGAAIKKK